MTRNNDFERLFNQLNGLSVGFGDVFRDLQMHQTGGYPPHNIYQVQDDDVRLNPTVVLELAVAGFKKNEITLTEHQGEISIQGLKADEVTSDNDLRYQHRGIATRNFIKRFHLAEYYEISDAKLEDGMLTVTFVKNVPEQDKPKQISIK